MPLIFAACGTAPSSRDEPPAKETPIAAEAPATFDDGLGELAAMTFACPKAALAAAAREAKKVPSQGSYQFSYFRVVNDSHHGEYEVHFKSNVHEEPELKYCVSLYCQQGWDPKTSKTTVQLMTDGPGANSSGAPDPHHVAACGELPKKPVKHRPKRAAK
jgi:hypothetical protein